MTSDVGLICKLVERALNGSESLSLEDRRDLHRAAAMILFPLDQERSAVAAHAATLLSEFEAHQMKFRELLRS
jgi:hypothetical protein